MSDQLTCPLCGHNMEFTLIHHLRDDHKVDPDAFKKQFPEQAMHSPGFVSFITSQRVHRRNGTLHYQLNVAGTPMTARYGVDHEVHDSLGGLFIGGAGVPVPFPPAVLREP